MRPRAYAALIASALVATSCGENAVADAGIDAGPQSCTLRRQCAGGGLCIRDGVAEMVFEPGEEGTCGPAETAIGHDAPVWELRAGGPPLADRLCTAQGLSPGEAIPSRRGELLRQTNPICWFNVTDGPLHGMSPPEDDFGLYRFGSEDDAMPIDPKPAREAMGWLARVGEGAVLMGAADDPRLHAPAEGRFALDFERPDGAWRVLWSLEPYDIELAGEMRLARDHLGREVLVSASRFSIGPSPLFLVPSGIGL